MRRLLFPAALIVFALSCGARSGIDVASSASGGEGGGASATSSGGGAPLPCSPGAPREILTIEDDGDLTQPSLVTLDTSPPTVALVYSRRPLDPGAAAVARVASFAGWSTWPPPAPSIVDLNDPSAGNGPVAGTALLATSRRSTAKPEFALLHSDDQGLLTRASLRSEAAGSIGKSSDALPGKPLMITSDSFTDDHFLSGVAAPDEGGFALHLTARTDQSTNSFNTLGCASTPISADAVGIGPGIENGWLAVAALGTDVVVGPNTPVPTSCASKFSNIGPATTLVAFRLDPAGQGMSSAEIMTDVPIVRVRMSPRTNGAWVTWGIEGRASLLSAILSATLVEDWLYPIDPFGTGVLVADSFDTKALGDRNEIIAVERTPGERDRLLFQQNSIGGTVGVPGFDFFAEGRVDGAVSLLISQPTDSALVAWSELPDGATRHRLRVARLECLSQP